MMDNINRNILGFQGAVRQYFAFLESQYGYKCIFSDMYIVKYCSDKVYLNVYHEKNSYELYFEVGMLPEDYNNQLRINSNDIMNSSSTLSKNTFYQASNKNDVYMIVEELADLIKIRATDALNASVEYFKTFACYREQKKQDVLRLQKATESEEKAIKAWINGDYKTVMEVYNTLDGALNQIQLKKLEYAKKMSN